MAAPQEAIRKGRFWANVFLWADSKESAIILARAHVVGLGWLAQDDALADDITDDPLDRYQGEESLPILLKARLSRSPGAVFVAQPGGPPTVGPQILPLDDPSDSPRH